MNNLLSSALLETFVEVARTGSVSDAARALHRSQPAISQRIKQLEDVLQVALFQPTGRGITLTREGEVLLAEARLVLARLRELPRLVDPKDAEARGPLRIGTLPTMARYLIVDAIEHTIIEQPNVQLRVELALESDLITKLRDGWLDAIFFIGQLDAFELNREHLGDVHIRVAAPPGWFGPSPTQEDLKARRLLIWRGANDPSFAQIERHARSFGLVRPNTPEIAHIETLKALVEKGCGFALLPDYVMGPEVQRGTLALSRFPDFETSFPIQVYTSQQRTTSVAIQRFLENARQTIPAHLPPIGSNP